MCVNSNGGSVSIKVEELLKTWEKASGTPGGKENGFGTYRPFWVATEGGWLFATLSFPSSGHVATLPVPASLTNRYGQERGPPGVGECG